MTTTANLLRPPAEVASISSVIGPEATLLLIERMGGIRIVVPSRARPGSSLGRTIGAPALVKLVEAYAGCRINVPLCKAWRVRVIVVLAMFVMMLWSIAQGRRLPVPQVPPLVSPLQHPCDEDVRELKHWRNNVELKLPDIERRVVRQDERLAAIERGIADIGQQTQNNGRMIQTLIDVGLRRERSE